MQSGFVSLWCESEEEEGEVEEDNRVSKIEMKNQKINKRRERGGG